MNRRTFLQTTLAATAGSAFISRTYGAPEAASAVEKAQVEIGRRFIDVR